MASSPFQVTTYAGFCFEPYRNFMRRFRVYSNRILILKIRPSGGIISEHRQSR
jgi:hypothetical protein